MGCSLVTVDREMNGESDVTTFARRPLIAVALALSAFGFCAQPAAAANWGQYGLNPWHSSYNKTVRSLTRRNVRSLKLAWSRAAGTGRWVTPVVAAQRVVTGNNGGVVVGFSAATGSKEWTSGTCTGNGAVSLAYANGSVFDSDTAFETDSQNAVSGKGIGCTEGAFGGLAVRGSVLAFAAAGFVGVIPQNLSQYTWLAQVGATTVSATHPAIIDGVVYASIGSTVRASSVGTGSVVWSHRFDAACACLSSPSVSPNGSMLYVGGGGGLYARRTSNGTALWTRPKPAKASTPADANGVLYVNSAGSMPGLYALTARTAAIRWRNAAIGRARGTPTVANGVVYDISASGRLEMINTATGKLIASKRDPHRLPFNHSATGQAVVVGGRVFVTTAKMNHTNYLDAFAR